MSNKIKRIDSIKDMAIFKNFNWEKNVRDKGNNVATFLHVNIIYGRNYSGKTTLSRIFRAIEIGKLPEHYDACTFELTFDDQSSITQDDLSSDAHETSIRVFNKDFIHDNLGFIGHDHSVNSFAILGQVNNDQIKKLQKLVTELGSADDRVSLAGKYASAQTSYNQEKDAYERETSSLNNLLSEKANHRKTGIKHQPFGDANYDINSIKNDIKEVIKPEYTVISEEKIDEYKQLLKEDPKSKIIPIQCFQLQYDLLTEQAKELIEKTIQPSMPIQELINDTLLAEWVRQGKKHHQNKRQHCAFCGNNLPKDLWEKLDGHFNQASEELREDIEKLIQSINKEKNGIQTSLGIDKSKFYAKFTNAVEALKNEFKTQSKIYTESLDNIQRQLETKRDNIFKSQTFDKPNSAEENLLSIVNKYNNICDQSNNYTNNLKNEQLNAKQKLRLNEVYIFSNDIGYDGLMREINSREKEMDAKKALMKKSESVVHSKEDEIVNLKGEMTNERDAARRINEYLQHSFGHPSLSIKATEVPVESGQAQYQFEIIRTDNEKKAYHLSEGERSLVAFCYFMAKLEDIQRNQPKPIIWIDDPISSLDSNHIFFVYSLIEEKIIKDERVSQLFISTHNLEFLRYLKKQSTNERKKQYLIVNRCKDSSNITLMPEYMKKYATEFNYLFNQIYQCATIDCSNDSNHEIFYNFGNNARKFLEVYLFYKYPNGEEHSKKMTTFFGKGNAKRSLINRLINDRSHFCGRMEGGAVLLDLPEMKTAAEEILKQIERKDPEQYKALCKGIE